MNRYIRSIEKLNFVNLNINFIGLLPKLFIEIILVLIGLSILFISVFILNIEMIELIPPLALVGAAFLKLVPSSIRILGQYQKIIYSKPSINLIENVLKESENYLETISFNKNIEEFKKLEVKNISHRYNKEIILDNINLEIFRGDLIVIKGESGNGKTTLLNIISGLIKPTKGDIFLNNKKYLFDSSVVTKLAYVGAENYFIDASIAENISLKSYEEISNSEINKIKKLMKDVNLSNFEDRLDMNIGEKATNLSEGQKQRLAIARALQSNPSLLIFDEATNSIDRDNEKIILQNISQNFPDLTIIFVSHRDLMITQKHKYFNLLNKKIHEKNTK